MLTATRIRLYPTADQRQALAVQFGCARWVFNNALAENQRLYQETGKSLNYFGMAGRLTALKKEHEWLKDADAQVLQLSVQRLARAYENFFAKRGRYPRFKSKHDHQSISYPQRVKVEADRIYLPKVGWTRAVVHRELFGKVKTVAVSMNACGQYHASILTDDGLEAPAVSTEGKAIGIDVGLTHLAITSDGSKFDNPRHLRKHERNLKRKQQSLSRKKKGSKSRAKAKKLVARVHERIACARKDHLHKLSRRIVNENQVICVETLNVKGMMKNHNLAKAVADVGWGMFTGFLRYKTEREGKAFVQCDRWFPSSKTCSACGSIHGKLPLDVRSWVCDDCGTQHDRDINAAINIRDEGLRMLAGGWLASAAGGSVSPTQRRKPLGKATASESRSSGL